MDTPMALNGLAHLQKIGEGTYGIVYKAKNRQTGDIVALKRMSFEDGEEGIPTTALREISSLKELHHPNIVRLLDVICEDKVLFLVFEHLEQDLKKYIDTCPPEGLSPQRVK
eukprot:Ihof_evm2s631 gene=Ihof_evmTU2s631